MEALLDQTFGGKLMNKKAQGYSTVVIYLFVGLVYFFGFAKLVGDFMQDQVTNNGLDGLLGFFLANLNFFVALIFAMGLFILARMS